MPVVRTDDRSGGRSVYGHATTKFSRMGRLHNFLTHGAQLARFARENSAIIPAGKAIAVIENCIRTAKIGPHLRLAIGFFQKNGRGGDKIKALGTKLSCEITP